MESCYSDLKINARGSKLDEALQTAFKLGYRRVAIDIEVEVSSKKTALPSSKELASVISEAKVPSGLQVLKRLTMNVNDPSLLHIAQNFAGCAEYDLTAIKTGNGKVFQSCCSNISTDILSLDMEQRLEFTIKRSHATQILDRGVVFEVCYVPAIKDRSICRHILSNTIELATQTKGKGIILSSGIEKSIELRGPQDIINFCHLFGLNTEKCKNCITKNCGQALLHSECRREVVKGVVSCKPIHKDKPEGKRELEEDSSSGNDFVLNKKQKLEVNKESI